MPKTKACQGHCEAAFVISLLRSQLTIEDYDDREIYNVDEESGGFALRRRVIPLLQVRSNRKCTRHKKCIRSSSPKICVFPLLKWIISSPSKFWQLHWDPKIAKSRQQSWPRCRTCISTFSSTRFLSILGVTSEWVNGYPYYPYYSKYPFHTWWWYGAGKIPICIQSRWTLPPEFADSVSTKISRKN